MDKQRGNQYSTQPNTQTTPAPNVVPSPPQQNPYIPERGAKRNRNNDRQAKQQKLRRTNNPNQGYANPQDARAAQQGFQGRQDNPYSTNSQRRPSAHQQKERRPHKPARHAILSLFLWLIMLAVLGLLALRLLPLSYSTGQMVPELVSLVPLAFIPAGICLVLALLWHRRILVVVCLVAIIANAIWHMGYFMPSQRVSNTATATVATSSSIEDSYARIMTINTLNGQASAKAIVDVCREENVEVLCLQEMTNSMVEDLKNAGIDEVLPYSLLSEGATSISNGGRNAIYTKAPMSNTSRNLLPIDTSSMPAADITIGSQTVRIVSVHPNSPVRGAQDLWDEGLSVIGSLSDYNHSYLIMGDFNSTWDHARFRELLGTTFVDASEQSGEGFHMTYPSNSLVPSLVEIDHIVYSNNSGITVSSLETIEIPGTDHKTLLATLEAN